MSTKNVAAPAITGASVAARLALAAGILACAGASLGLCVAYCAEVVADGKFLISNEVPAATRTLMSAAVGGGALLFLACAAIPFLRRRLAAVDEIARTADLLAPVCLAAFVPPLLAYRAWEGHALPFLALLAVAGPLAEQLFTRAFAALPPAGARPLVQSPWLRWLARSAPLLVVCTASLAYAIYFSHYSVLNHRRFGTAGFDLGINVSWCWNALHGNFFRAPVLFGPDGGSMIAGHAIFAVFLWLPIYAIAPGAESLLVYQSVTAGIAAIPLFMFARTQLPRWPAALVALAYLSFAPLHGPNFYDYHELLAALPWHFLLYWMIATNRTRWAWLVVVVLWAHREDLAVGTAILGAVLFLSGARPKFGARLAAVSFVWFMTDKFVIMPLAGSWWFASIYKDLMPEGHGGYGGVVQTMLINPAYLISTLLTQEKLVYFLHIFAPLVFLPLRKPALALLAFPGFFFTLMTTGYAPTLSIAFQYTTHFIPYVFGATVLSLRVLNRESVARQQGALTALALVMLAHSVCFGAVFQHDTFVGGFGHVQFIESAADIRRYEAFKKMVSVIPQNASVAASETVVSHVAARMNVYTLKVAHGDADYLVVQKDGGAQKVLQAAFDRNTYGLVKDVEGTYFLFKRGLTAPGTARALTILRIKPKNEAKH